MSLPQSGRLDGGEQPQGLPDERAQRLLAGTIFIPALDSELPLMGRDYGAGALLHIPPWRSHTLSPGRFRRCNGAGVPQTATAIADFLVRELTTSATASFPDLPGFTTRNLQAKP